MSNILFIGRKMEKKEALKLIRGGQAKVWNGYRQDNPDWEPDLSYEDLSSCRLKLQDGSYFDFSKTNLCGTKFSEDWAYMTRALKNAKFNADTKGLPENNLSDFQSPSGSVSFLGTIE